MKKKIKINNTNGDSGYDYKDEEGTEYYLLDDGTLDTVVRIVDCTGGQMESWVERFNSHEVRDDKGNVDWEAVKEIVW